MTDTVRSYIRRSNYLVIEADYDSLMLSHGPYPVRLQDRIRGDEGHLSNEECAQVLADNYHENLRNIWLCHMSGVNNKPGQAKKTVMHLFQSRYIMTCKDFLLEELQRNKPTGPWTLGGAPEPRQLNLFEDE